MFKLRGDGAGDGASNGAGRGASDGAIIEFGFLVKNSGQEVGQYGVNMVDVSSLRLAKSAYC